MIPQSTLVESTTYSIHIFLVLTIESFRGKKLMLGQIFPFYPEK